MKLANKNIYLLSTESWDSSFLSKHHYSLELAARDNTVYFINPPVSSKKKVQLEQVDDKIYSVTYSSVFRGSNRLPELLRNFLQRIEIKRLVKGIKTRPDVIWSFDPYRFQNLNHFGAELKIYHSVDVHHSPLESKCADTADVVFAVSDVILETIGTKTPKYQIDHGLSEEFISLVGREMILNSSHDKIRVGFVGNLLKRDIDIDAFGAIIKNHPEIEFNLIGPYAENDSTISQFWDEMFSRENVKWLGKKKSEDIPQVIKEFDVFILCSDLTIDPIAVSNSHKILEYLSTGKVIVSHLVDQYKSTNELLVMGNNTEDYISKFDDVVNNLEKYNSPEKQRKRIEFALSKSYKSNLNKIESLF